jgi:hypothetical protein
MLKRKVMVVMFALLLTAIITGCALSGLRGNGVRLVQDRAVDSFSGVSFSAAGNVNIRFGESYSVAVTTDSNLQSYITTDVTDNVLVIDVKDARGGLTAVVGITVDITMPEINAITVSGAGEVKLFEGEGTDLSITLSGAGNIDAQEYQVKNAIVDCGGVGSVKVWATESLSGKLSGVGSIHYKGDPPSMTVERTGVGSISPL